MEDKVARFLFAGALILALLVGGIGGVALDRAVLIPLEAAKPATADQGLDVNLIQQAWGVIQQNYVDRKAVQPLELTYGAISGMTDALGDTGHSRFLSPEMVRQEHTVTQGSYEGIGANVAQMDGHIVIVSPMDGSPAQDAGLKPGDEIVKVDGEDVTGQPLSTVIGKILGPAGSTVTLTIQDPHSGQQRDVKVKRAKIVLHDVSWAPIPGTDLAAVRISGFNQGVSEELKTALGEIKAQGLKGVVLDLRNNPGGLLDESVKVASQFLSSGNVLQERDAAGNVKPVRVQAGGVATQLPVIVLINNGTASAAEIVSGALQDAHRAQLVGQTTFGTGTVLLEFPLSDGSALLLATKEWLTPAGHSIWHEGITPNDAVDLDPSVTLLRPDALRSMDAQQLQAAPDVQFLKAVSLLEAQIGQ